MRAQRDPGGGAGENACRQRQRQRQVAWTDHECADHPRQTSVLHGYFSFDELPLARRKVSAAEFAPWLNVPASSVPSAFSVPVYELTIGTTSSVTLAPFCVIASGSSSSP